MEKIIKRPPFSYYGGKQRMCSKILPLIPEHTLYCEPFLGGAAVFWAKEPSEVEVLNDTNRELINFYSVVQNDFISLEKEIRISLHSRDLHRKAGVINANPDMFSEIKRAWAVWVLNNQSFASKMNGPWGFDKSRNCTTKKITNKREAFTEEYAIRLQHVQLESADALQIIRRFDSKDSFFYCDPPYYNSDCAHYDGYTVEDFEMLLKRLAEIEGKFLLSSYPSDILKEFTKLHGWQTLTKDSKVSVNAKGGNQKIKTEVLTANYEICDKKSVD